VRKIIGSKVSTGWYLKMFDKDIKVLSYFLRIIYFTHLNNYGFMASNDEDFRGILKNAGLKKYIKMHLL